MSRNISLWALVILMFIAIALLGQSLQAQTYSLPNVNSGCPSNCRLIPWQAGSDLWNGGTLPTYGQVTCSPLHEDGVTDDTADINACITAAAAGTGAYSTCHAVGGCAVYIPAGTVYINGTVRLKGNVVLRGAGPTTQINEGASGILTTQSFSYDAGQIYPSWSYGSFPSTYCYLSGTPQKGDTSVTINSSGSCAVSAGTWIMIYGNDNPSLISANGTDGHCDWCGNSVGFYLQQQIVQVTSLVSGTGGAGSVVNLGRPLYYPPDTTSRVVSGVGGSGTQTEPAGAKYSIITFPTQKAGYEYFHVTATGDIGANQIIWMNGCLYCWVKGVETQETGSSSGSAHVELDYCYGNEIRDGYYHDQRSGASGAGYGVYFQFTNSDHKVENNICRHSRHCTVYQGGGSGTAVLYNYFDDMYTDDTTYLGSARTSHGAHPFMNLFEGNVISHIAADDYWGTTSHDVFFRNWLWGDETMNWSGAVAPAGTPSGGFIAADLYQSQEYYSYVGNVLGHTGLHTTWSGATLLSTSCGNSCCCDGTEANPIVYDYSSTALSGPGGSAATTSATILRHGNWDYKTVGVAYWDGGSNHTLATSMYYTSEPSYLSGYTWPLEGPEGNPTINANAAENCWLNGPATGGSFNPAVCYASGNPPVKPAPPTSLTVIVN